MRDLQPILITPILAFEDNYIWVIANHHQQSALIVDPGDAQPVIAYLEQHRLKLGGILITHHHWDHVNGVADLVEYCRVPVYGSTLNGFSKITHHLDEGAQNFTPAYFPNFRVLAIPGHTNDHIGFYAGEILFCGDTLFSGGCGRLFEGSAEQLYKSLQKIAALPDTTKIYCAHEYTLNNLRFAQHVEPSNPYIKNRIKTLRLIREQGLPTVPSLLREEKQTNPFLRCSSPEIVQQSEHHTHQSLPNPLAVFTVLRSWKDGF